MQLKVDDLRGREILELLTEHLRSLADVTPVGSMHALNLAELRRPEIKFWSVWEGQQLAGCGALKELSPTHGEIKSMRTAKTHLRRGVATLVLKQIFSEAKERGYRRLSLETGASNHFAAAHALYRKFGFLPSGPFAEYTDDPNSVFMTIEVSERHLQ